VSATVADDEVAKRPEPTEAGLRAAIAAHLAGFPWDVIAERYNYQSPKTAQTAVETAIGNSWTSSDLSAARNKSLSRKEAILRGLYNDATQPYVLDKDGKSTGTRNDAHLPAVDRALRVLESIDRLLGLNAPVQMEIYRPDADEFMQVVTAMKQKLLEGEVKEADIFDAEVMDDEDESDAS
jgi:hypothetical protein